MAIDGFDPGRNGGGHVNCEMSSASKSCKMSRQHYYWNHMRGDQRQFIVRASGDFKDSLHIPREVGSHLRSMISETMNLEAPNGIFPIEVCREMGVLVLRSGWDEFVTAHHIEENYRFLFTYRGNSTFKVHIFNPAGLEKPSFCSQPPSQIFGGIPHGAPCDPHVLNEQVPPDPAHVQTSTDFGYTTLPGCRLTKAQDEKVLDIARTMRSEMPLYVTTMNKSNVHLKDCSVNMPLKLLDHFQEDISKATVQLEDSDCNLYSVEASKHTDDQIVLQSGWYDFVVFHSIREKDLLIFRSKGRTRLQVLIIRPGSHQRTSLPHAVYSTSSSDDEHIVGEDTKKSSRWQKKVPDRCVKTQKVASTSSPSTKPGYEAHELNGGASVELGVDSEPLSSNNPVRPSQCPYIIAEWITSLTGPMKKKVEEKVQTIRSELPIFVAVMTQSRIIGRYPCLRFCTEYGRYLPDIKQALVLQLEGSEMEWRTTFITDKKGGRWIRAGWPEFVAGNHLQLDDIVLFQLAKSTNEVRMSAGKRTSELRMTVYLLRKLDIEE